MFEFYEMMLLRVDVTLLRLLCRCQRIIFRFEPNLISCFTVRDFIAVLSIYNFLSSPPNKSCASVYSCNFQLANNCIALSCVRFEYHSICDYKSALATTTIPIRINELYWCNKCVKNLFMVQPLQAYTLRARCFVWTCVRKFVRCLYVCVTQSYLACMLKFNYRWPAKSIECRQWINYYLLDKPWNWNEWK